MEQAKTGQSTEGQPSGAEVSESQGECPAWLCVCMEREREKELMTLSQERREVPSAVCVEAPVQIAER